MTIAAGTKLGRYEIRTKIGEGGMGEVYLAQDTRLDRKVALKILPADVAAHPDRMKRFVQEAKAASALNHPNIITIHEIDKWGSSPTVREGVHFIATEFIDGETLRERMRIAPMKLGEVLDVAAQIASALADAHGAGIIHRDLKPENIMLRRDGIVKVLDFGLAKLAEPKESGPEDLTRELVRTGTGIVMGTTAYMSPEQARGLPVDARTDIWSLGVTLYEMLSNRLPFAGDTNSDVLAAILEREPKSLTSLSTEVMEPLEWIVTKMLTKNRDERYQTAREMLNDIRRLTQRLNAAAEIGRGVASQSSPHSATPRETSPPTSAVSSSRSRKPIIWAAVLILMALVATFAVWKGKGYWFKSAPQPRVVVLMDSPLPDRVYDPETRKNGGTNADDITDIISDLPVVIEKENTSSLWHREDQVLRESPALIVIHRSCFADSSVAFDPNSSAALVDD